MNGPKWVRGTVSYEIVVRGCVVQRHIDQLRLRVDDDADELSKNSLHEVEINVNAEMNNTPVINNLFNPFNVMMNRHPKFTKIHAGKSRCAADDDTQPATSSKTLLEEPAENTLR